MTTAPASDTTGDQGRSRGRPPRHSVDELVHIVATEFLARGYDATSMEDLARATGLTKAALYHHVPGKEQFLQIAVARGVDALTSVVDDAEASDDPALERLERVLRRSVEVLSENLPYVTLLLRVRGNTATEQWALERRRELDTRTARLTAQAVAEGGLQPGTDPKLLTRLMFGAVNSLTEWYRPEGGMGVRQIGDALVGLLPTADRQPAHHA